MFRWISGDQVAPREFMYAGVAGCGKTRTAAEWLKLLCLVFPGSKWLLLRQTRVSLNESFLDIWEDEVLGPDHPSVLGGPKKESRRHYDFPPQKALSQIVVCRRCWEEEGDRYHPHTVWLNPACQALVRRYLCQVCGGEMEVYDDLGGQITLRTSRVVLGGMDAPRKLFSTQYNGWFWNEMQEGAEEDWESLHRAARRQGTPFRIGGGDCNPEHQEHWARKRADDGPLHELVGKFQDNPTITRDYILRLKENLSGVRYKRLFLGLWVAAEGQVWENWDPSVHLLSGDLQRDDTSYWLKIGAEPYRELLWFIGGQDIGHEQPGCAQVWGFDADKRAYRVAEVYRTKWDHDQWASAWERLYSEFPMVKIVCDHDQAFIHSLNERLGPYHGRHLPSLAVPWKKTRQKGEEKTGIDIVRVLLRKREDGTRGLYMLRDCFPYGKDPLLREKRMPLCTEEEIPAYVYPVLTAGERYKEEPLPECPDHGCDTMRGVMSYVFDKDFAPPKDAPKYPPKSLGALLHHEEIFGED